MQIEPKDGPTVAKPATATPTARDRAIAKLSQAQEAPVQNPTKVAPEEMSAITGTSEGQTTTNESTEPAVTKAQEDPLSTQYAVLARKEKALRSQVQKLNAEREAFKAQQEAAKSPTPQSTQPDESFKARLQRDPLSVLSEYGITYDKLVDSAMNQPKPEEQARLAYEAKIETELKSIREAQERSVKAQEEQQQASYKQAVDQIRMEAKHLITTDPTYEAIRETNSIRDVVELIEETFKKDGVLLTVEEAATEVENYLVEEALKIAKINKIKQRLQPASSPAKQQQAPVQKQQQTMKTLTNSVGSSRQLSARERAVLAFKGELKS